MTDEYMDKRNLSSTMLTGSLQRGASDILHLINASKTFETEL
jgi:hypothetical protein